MGFSYESPFLFLGGEPIMDEYFGHKELYEVILRAKTPMQFGSRKIESEEPVLYFNNVNMSLLSEQNRPVFARGGWANMPRVIWDERTEATFQMTEGVMSSVGMSILLSANVTTQTKDEPLYVPMKEGPFSLDVNGGVILKHWPVDHTIKKSFIFDYDREAVQEKKYGKLITNKEDPLDPGHFLPYVQIFDDKNLETPADNSRKYVIDYYYKYEQEALIYSVQKERFNGLFTLEAKFYSKDENEGLNYTNVLFMPKVRVVSNINLRLGERADPTVSTFNIVGLPETVGNKKNLILEIIRLQDDIDSDI